MRDLSGDLGTGESLNSDVWHKSNVTGDVISTLVHCVVWCVVLCFLEKAAQRPVN
jgi:ATP-binding cassette subfamily A (ABC1) protein 3